MNVNDIIGKLEGLNNPEVQASAQQAVRISSQYKSGQISLSEYQELMGDLEIENLIVTTATGIQEKQQLETIASTIISAVEILV